MFSRLENGWYHGEGRKFSEEVINRVAVLIDKCLENSLFEIDVFPGLDADIRLTIYEPPDYHEFTIGDSISYIHERNAVEQSPEERMTLDDALSKISDIGKRKWTLSELLIHTTGMTSESTGFRVLHSGAVRGYLSLITSAPSQIVDAHVPT